MDVDTEVFHLVVVIFFLIREESHKGRFPGHVALQDTAELNL